MKANGPNGIESLRRDTATCVDPYRMVGDRLLRNILQAMAAA